MKVRFHEVPVCSLDGTPIENATIYKSLANAIYQFSPDLDLVEIAMQINKGEEVELSSSQVETLKKLIRNERAGFMAFAQKAFLDYLDEVEAADRAAKAAEKAQQK